MLESFSKEVTSVAEEVSNLEKGVDEKLVMIEEKVKSFRGSDRSLYELYQKVPAG